MASQNWSLICDLLLSRGLEAGLVFQLRQGEVLLLCEVTALPHLNITEQVLLYHAFQLLKYIIPIIFSDCQLQPRQVHTEAPSRVPRLSCSVLSVGCICRPKPTLVTLTSVFSCDLTIYYIYCFCFYNIFWIINLQL